MDKYPLLLCFKKSWIQPKFKSCTLIIAFANTEMTSLRPNHLRKILYYLNKGKKKYRQESTVIIAILESEIKTAFCLHLELRCPISTVSPAN